MTSCACPEMHFDSVFSKILFIACHVIFGDNFCLKLHTPIITQDLVSYYFVTYVALYQSLSLS